MIGILIGLIDIASKILFLLVLAHVILSYFMSPFHPVRQWIDRIVEPMLRPIRERLPMFGMLDFSPVVLLIAIQLLTYILKLILLRFF